VLVSNYPNVSINTANPPTELARRDAARRDLFDPVTESGKSGAEKPLLSDEKARSAGNTAANVNLYDANGKDNETRQAISERGDRQQQGEDARRGNEQSPEQQEKQQQLERQEQQEIQQLKSRDQEVRAHEQAHAAIGGRYAGAPSYSYEQGPDGKQYAVAGEVQIDIAPVPGDPQATVQKMQQVRSAALAPAEPSAADRRIAAQAAQQQVQAQAELVQQNAALSSTGLSAGAEQAQSAADANAISFSSNENGSSVVAQRETLAMPSQMQLRRSVIAGFYQRATEPQQRQSLQQA
jgi:hypothetical protein